MALNERNRNALYRGLIRTVEDEEAVDAMLSHFPASDLDQPATRDHVRAEVAGLDQRMTIGFAETHRRVDELDQRMTIGFAETHRRIDELDQRATIGFAESHRRIAGLDQRMTIGFAETHRRIDELDARLDRKIDERYHQLDRRVTEGFAAVLDQVHREMRQWFLWSYGAMFVLLTAVVAAAKILE